MLLDINKTLWINMLLDFYGGLLTDKQQLIMEMYYKEDLSLSEIASEQSVSRNAVHDHLNRTLKVLENYEAQLELVKLFQVRQKIYDDMRDKVSDPVVQAYINQLEELE